MAVDQQTLKKEIKAILEDASAEGTFAQLTAKKVRAKLEEKFGDLSERKKEVDKLVMDLIEEQAEEEEEASPSESESEEEVKPKKSASKKRKSKASDSDEEKSDEDYRPEGKKSKGKKASDSDSDEDWKGARKAAPKKSGGGGRGGGGAKKGGGGGTGYTKACTLSPELSAVMGAESMARHEVVKKMWALIKEKNLYDPKNKQFAICNEQLLPVFGVKRFRTFGMMKYLKTHFRD